MFCLFYAIAYHFLVIGEGEGERADFKETMTNLDMTEGGREVQKNAKGYF